MSPFTIDAFQLIDQDVDFGGCDVGRLGIVSEGAIAGAIDDLEEDRDERIPALIFGQYVLHLGLQGLKGGRAVVVWVGLEQGGGDSVAEAAETRVVFATVAAVGEEEGEGLLACCCGSFRIAVGGFDIVGDVPCRPQRGRMAEGFFAGYSAADFSAHFIIAAQATEGVSEIVACVAFVGHIVYCSILVSGLPTECDGFHQTTESVAI